MKIDGRLIADELKNELKEKITSLKITPHIAVLIIGNDPNSLAYIRQKRIASQELGVKFSIFSRFNRDSIAKEELVKLVNRLNADKSVHGIIIQRPVPIDINKEELDRLVMPEKDVDGFHPNSPFTPPIASAVLRILEWVYKGAKDTLGEKVFINWLKKKKILVIGRGETAGLPIAETLGKKGAAFIVANSQTTNLKDLCLNSDIIISCVGKSNVVRHDMVKSSTILIGVGLHAENGKLKPDYNQEEIEDRVAYFTPVPGGVGPVNVACLFENLVLNNLSSQSKMNI